MSRTEISEIVKRWNFSRKFHFSARFVSYRLKLEQSLGMLALGAEALPMWRRDDLVQFGKP